MRSQLAKVLVEVHALPQLDSFAVVGAVSHCARSSYSKSRSACLLPLLSNPSMGLQMTCAFGAWESELGCQRVMCLATGELFQLWRCLPAHLSEQIYAGRAAGSDASMSALVAGCIASSSTCLSALHSLISTWMMKLILTPLNVTLKRAAFTLSTAMLHRDTSCHNWAVIKGLLRDRRSQCLLALSHPSGNEYASSSQCSSSKLARLRADSRLRSCERALGADETDYECNPLTAGGAADAS